MLNGEVVTVIITEGRGRDGCYSDYYRRARKGWLLQ
jgi:hypothetical protein